jgi:hypothetical protein
MLSKPGDIAVHPLPPGGRPADPQAGIAQRETSSPRLAPWKGLAPPGDPSLG